MIARVKSGFPKLDEAIRGGIPENSVILVYGPPKCGKTIFSMQFFYEGLKEEEPGMYAVTEFSVENLREYMFIFNRSPIPYEEMGLVYYIDLFSIRSGGKLEESEIVKNINPRSLTDIMIGVSEGYRNLCPKGIRVRTVFDSITALIEQNPNTLTTALRTFIAKSKNAGSTTILTYTEKTADERMETLFKSLVDGTIHLDGRGKLTVESMMATPCPQEIEYQITDAGII